MKASRRVEGTLGSCVVLVGEKLDIRLLSREMSIFEKPRLQRPRQCCLGSVRLNYLSSRRVEVPRRRYQNEREKNCKAQSSLQRCHDKSRKEGYCLYTNPSRGRPYRIKRCVSILINQAVPVNFAHPLDGKIIRPTSSLVVGVLQLRKAGDAQAAAIDE